MIWTREQVPGVELLAAGESTALSSEWRLTYEHVV